ncbi:hypothetical protein [Micromonospora sp. HM5-17]|uniref:hypothetical protein n=1 Tax=Micromonospora sp. HM5-17 TaxID=2487710 RepID=UPI000F473474|nr:hypothetical protein [Micromonospora sp. HM5-17]ROT33983.1 hypothetical protein EF879_03620 [Micromonospora sp. HM5-17]
MDALHDLAGRLDDAGETLARLARRLPYAGPPEAALDPTSPGRPGEIGRLLHRQWLTALDDRIRELSAAADRLADTAAALRSAAREYADADDAVRRRLAGEA